MNLSKSDRVVFFIAGMVVFVFAVQIKGLIFVPLAVIGFEMLRLSIQTSNIKKKVLGAYESASGNATIRLVLLKSGAVEDYLDGVKRAEGKWDVVNKDVHIEYNDGLISVNRIDTRSYPYGKVSGVTEIATIENGERVNLPNNEQDTLRKIWVPWLR